MSADVPVSSITHRERWCLSLRIAREYCAKVTAEAEAVSKAKEKYRLHEFTEDDAAAMFSVTEGLIDLRGALREIRRNLKYE